MLHTLNLRTKEDYSQITSYLRKLHYKPLHSKIFIKPNIGASSPKVNTSPDLVRTLIHYLIETGISPSNITIGESSVDSTLSNFQNQGWSALASEEHVNLVDLESEERIGVPWKYGTINLPKLLFTHSYINVAKMKTHMQTTVSLCIKNQKGLLDTFTRKLFHRLGLHSPISELAKTIKPELSILDGKYIIEGNGPGDFGIERYFGKVIISDNIIDVDYKACELMGINPKMIPHLSELSSTFNVDPYIIPTIKLPSSEFKILKCHIQLGDSCSSCVSSVGKTVKCALKSPFSLKFFLKHGVFSRLDFIIGSPKTLPEDHGHIVFYGNCTKEIASRYPEYPFITGCSPNPKEAIKQLR